MRLLLPLVFVALQACSALEPTGGEASAFTYSPYAAASQPNPERVILAPRITDTPQPPIASSAGTESYQHLPRPVIENLVGPGRVCRDGLRVELFPGEREVTSNASIWIYGGDIDLLVESWIYELPRDQDFLRSTGFVTVPGLGEVERIEITRPNPTGPRYAYVINTQRVAMFRRLGVSSTSFEGTEADLASLARIARDRTGDC